MFQNFKKIGIYVAHDDDLIFGMGGKIIQHLKNGDDVYAVICTDGKNSHKIVLGIENNPSPMEIKTKRKKEIKKAIKILGISEKKLFFLKLTDGEGKVRQNEEGAKTQIMEISKKEKPDIVYFNYSDAHADHRAVNKIMLEVLRTLKPQPKAYQFLIWTKKLAKNRPDVDENQAPEIPFNALKININKELELKRKALFEMKSQIDIHPYPEWQVQIKPIIDKNFIDYFLRGEEVFIKVENSN